MLDVRVAQYRAMADTGSTEDLDYLDYVDRDLSGVWNIIAKTKLRSSSGLQGN